MRNLSFIFLFFAIACSEQTPVTQDKPAKAESRSPCLVVLGTLQDGGSPHAGCKKNCCGTLFRHPDPDRKVVSLGLIDPGNKHTWLLEATPDIATQMKELHDLSAFSANEAPDGIFLTHAHIGHYAGLMYLGREAMGVRKVPVYAMPKMRDFLTHNGPWSQLIKLENIELKLLQENLETALSAFTVTPFRVPHRDEFSETVGYRIKGPARTALFIPDIDKWEKWNRSIIEEIRQVDYALIDATFFDGAEINNRDIKEVPHPFVIETMELLGPLSPEEKAKVYFIHFNHTNPLLNDKSAAALKVKREGYNIARKGDRLPM